MEFPSTDTFFNKGIEEIDSLLDIIGSNFSSMIMATVTKKRTFFIRGEILLCAQNTLKSIDYCCSQGFFSDAYVLARKYRDDLMLYLFLVDTVDKQNGKGDEENPVSCKDLTEEEFVQMVMKTIEELYNNERKDIRELVVGSWLRGELRTEYDKIRKDYFAAAKYVQNLIKNSYVKEAYNRFFKAVWEEVDTILNNYTHVNSPQYVLANICSNRSEQNELCKSLEHILHQITVIFLSMLILIHPQAIMSGEYEDYLDFGVIPPDGAQYRVASGVIDYIHAHFDNIDSQLCKYLNDHNKYNMKILEDL